MAKKAYTKSELKKFEKNILEKIGEINESIEGVRSTTQPNNSVFIEERSEDFNEGTEAHEVEKNFLLMSRESDYIVNLNKALQRIKDGNYGICEVYQKDAEKCECPDSPLIAKERLMEVPNATKGVFCKEKKKLNLL
ncbi:MAG: hypothetical protein L7S51_00885 [Candidatus Marinimicrobia bacterium]|nr:hypothetical protein [Candidatus Neomarinimicrobiota bacterium]